MRDFRTIVIKWKEAIVKWVIFKQISVLHLTLSAWMLFQAYIIHSHQIQTSWADASTRHSEFKHHWREQYHSQGWIKIVWILLCHSNGYGEVSHESGYSCPALS